MDRRQQKTRKAIFDAFEELISQKSYSNITVQEIINQANIGRSTFYAHFETKDELLKEMCNDIFEHVFKEKLVSEKYHDFSENPQNLKDKLTHLLYHLQENHKKIWSVLSCESGNLFMRYFKEYLMDVFSNYIEKNDKVPRDFILNYYVGCFTEIIMWWYGQGMKYTPEQLAEYFLAFGVK